jgi:anti-sigma factor RsiW
VNRKHDPERDAAAFLGGALSRRAAERFEAHLVECDACWREVASARGGRALAESLREVAPQSLREDVRASVSAARGARARFGARKVVVALAAAAAVAAASFGGVLLFARDAQPPEIVAALHEFRARVLPEDQSSARAPDLSALDVTFVGAGSGRFDSMRVDAFAYRDRAGRRIVVYLGARAFRTPRGAWNDGGAWRARYEDIDMVCDGTFMVLGDRGAAVEKVAAALQA